MNQNRVFKVCAAGCAIAVMAASFAACNSAPKGDEEYFEKINAYTFWDNEGSEAIPQPNVGQMVWDFLSSPAEDGKAKKVAFIGYDGCRSDVLINSIVSGAEGGVTEKNPDSALNKLLDEGGHIYHAYAGGIKGTATEQHTSTAPGWSALTTRVWGQLNGITDNGMPKNINYKTFMLRAAEELGMRSTFAASWQPHFTENYVDEIQYLKDHPEIPMTFQYVKDDAALRDYLIDCVTAGSANEKDIIFGTLEGTDHAGHDTGFGNDNPDYIQGFLSEEQMALDILNAIESRPTYAQEDWLIVIVTDHGGIGTGHGGQTLEERNTWVACNKPIGKEYMSAGGYNGYEIEATTAGAQ